MKIRTSDLRTERQWRASTGLTEKQFFTLLPHFKEAYVTKYKADLASRLVKNSIRYAIENEEELLLFTLISVKSGVTYDLLGIFCGMDCAGAKRNQEIGLDVLVEALIKLKVMPKRELTDGIEVKKYLEGVKTIIIDATEQRIQRPEKEQKEYYSGKKKAHTKKVYC